LTDRIGRKPVLMLACILGIVGALPVFLLLNHPSGLMAQLGQLGLVAMIGLYGGAQPTIMVETAPLPVRCTAVALGYNLSLGVIGGVAPPGATRLGHRPRGGVGPGVMILAPAAGPLAAPPGVCAAFRAPVTWRGCGPAAAYA